MWRILCVFLFLRKVSSYFHFVDFFAESSTNLVNSSFRLSSFKNPGNLNWSRHLAKKNEKKMLFFIAKALFILKIFKFLFWLFGHVEKMAWLEDKFNFEFHDVTNWLNTIIIHILPNISRIKGKQIMRFGQFIKHSKRNIFI